MDERERREYKRRWKRLGTDLTPAGEVRDHIDELREAGMTLRGIAEAAGLSLRCVRGIAIGTTTRTHARTSVAILSVDPPPPPPSPSPSPSRRRRRPLAAQPTTGCGACDRASAEAASGAELDTDTARRIGYSSPALVARHVRVVHSRPDLWGWAS